MVAVDAPGTANDATYGYDHRGTRVSQTTGGQTRRFLYDKRNPTGYAKAIEERVEGTLDRSYVLGLRVEGQADSQGMVYFLLDGHGSNRALLDTNGSVQANYDYEAFGDAIGFTAASARTTYLFGGDGFYDAATGWTYHLARWRSGFWFTSADDPQFGNVGDPITLHKYLYCAGNPVTYADFDGHDFSITSTLATGAILGAAQSAMVTAINGGDEWDVAKAAIGGAITGAIMSLAGAFFARTMTGALMSSGFTQNMALGITGTFFGAAGAGMSAYGFHKAWQEGDRVGMAFAGAGFLLSASMFAMSGKTLYNGIVRTGYVREVQALRGLADSARAAGQGEEATARMLHQMRRGIGVKYKDMTPARELAQIKAGNLKEYGDELGPSVEFLRAQGKSWAEIIESACRPGGHRYGWGLD